jgi:SAM-dependent methyltransferase
LSELHYIGNAYNVDSFIKKRSGLYQIEIDEMGDVKQKSLLHLQCHFGMDTLSWNLRGANPVVGVDFSEKAITYAIELSEKMNLNARFINCNIYDLKQQLDEKFDIIFSSYGSILWLHDLQSWANLISHYLKPGGFYYIIDSHPMCMAYDDTHDNNDIILKYSYFKTQKPLKFIEETSYANSEVKLKHTIEYSWNYSLSEILNSLISAGLHIEFFNEHTEVPWQMFKMLESREEGLWTFPEHWQNKKFPLLFSLKARKT